MKKISLFCVAFLLLVFLPAVHAYAQDEKPVVLYDVSESFGWELSSGGFINKWGNWVLVSVQSFRLK